MSEVTLLNTIQTVVWNLKSRQIWVKAVHIID